MAEIIQKNNRSNKNGANAKRINHPTRVDLTPMVDLGFLLITFFIFTTTIAQPTSLNLFMPKDSTDSTLVSNSGALTVLLSRNNSVFYYQGRDWQQMKVTDYRSLRSVILSKKKMTKAEDFFVIIKPGNDATYKNAIDVLDEMSINDVQRYAFSEAVPEENRTMDELKKGK
ncbi:MAG: biopolymer transporter ExbD [Ginsengibacter sp.]